MPIPDARYVVTKKGGKKVRLAFVRNKVVEAKVLATGSTHTKEEFKRDRMRAKKKKKKRR